MIWTTWWLSKSSLSEDIKRFARDSWLFPSDCHLCWTRSPLVGLEGSRTCQRQEITNSLRMLQFVTTWWCREDSPTDVNQRKEKKSRKTSSVLCPSGSEKSQQHDSNINTGWYVKLIYTYSTCKIIHFLSQIILWYIQKPLRKKKKTTCCCTNYTRLEIQVIN